MIIVHCSRLQDWRQPQIYLSPQIIQPDVCAVVGQRPGRLPSVEATLFVSVFTGWYYQIVDDNVT